MAFDSIPRTHAFSLGDLHEYDRCVFSFFVKHHLRKRYELAEGNVNQTIGTLLDLAMKKLHKSGAYDQPVEYLQNLVKAAEREIRADVEKRGKLSFYGAQIDFLTPEVISQAQEIFKKYTAEMAGNFKKLVSTAITQRTKPFWERIILSNETLKLWGGPDAIELGEDGIPEVVDYKYYEDLEKAQKNLDMDLMPKVYILLCAADLQESGFQKARFKVRFWQEPKNEAFYEEFDLANAQNLEDFLKDKIQRILRTSEITFCEKDYCQVCKHPDRSKWLQELKDKGFVKLWKE